MSGDRNLLFGALAMQAGLLSADQFAEACSIWAAHNVGSLASILCDQGWLVEQDVAHVEYLVERTLTRAEGDLKASFAGLSGEILGVLATVGDDTQGRRTQAICDSSSTETDLTFDLSPPKHGPRYSLSRLHAAGGIGEIWLARDMDLQRNVAVKRLHSHKSPSANARMRFLREARITGQLDHPGVVPIYELCLDEVTGHPYYAMRFLHGRTLTVAVEKYHEARRTQGSDPQTFVGLLNAFAIVCNTVAFAHSKVIIHRDLKCENVILGDYGEVVVIDWGLAKEVGSYDLDPAMEEMPFVTDAVNPLATLAGHILGSPAYMAPEQATGRMDLIGPQTDVYGLCAMLYEILCGRPPFVGTQTQDVLFQVRETVPVKPSEIAPGIPAALEQICMQGLEKAQANRPQSADCLARAILSWISDLAEKRQAEEERERFFALSFDLLAIIDHQGQLRQMSPAWERLLGYERAELTGRQFDEFIHPEDVSNSIQDLGTAANPGKGSPLSFESRVLHRDGSPRWFSWQVTPIPQEKCVYVVGRDITALKKSQQLFEGILQSAPDAMVLLNEQGQIVMVNRQTERIFGYTPGEMLGQPVEMLIPQPFRDQHPTLVAGFFKHATTRSMGSGQPLPGLRNDGQIFQADISLSPIITENGTLVAASIREMPDRPPHRPPTQHD